MGDLQRDMAHTSFRGSAPTWASARKTASVQRFCLASIRLTHALHSGQRLTVSVSGLRMRDPNLMPASMERRGLRERERWQHRGLGSGPG